MLSFDSDPSIVAVDPGNIYHVDVSSFLTFELRESIESINVCKQ